MHGAIGSGHADFETEPLEVHVGGETAASEVEGLRLVQRGQTIATYDGDTQAWSDTLQVAIATGPHTDVHFLDHDGDVLELGDDYSLEVVAQDPAIARFIQDNPGGFAIHFRGVAAGQAGFVFKLKHGDHTDFETEPLRVRVGGS